MLKVDLLVVGSLKEKYWKDASLEYQKRLSRYCQLKLIEIKEEYLKDNAHQADIDRALQKEAETITKKITGTDYVVVLAIAAKQLSSEEFAKTVQKYENLGKKIVIIVGSSHGLAPSIYERADMQISLSLMTFPHQMIRIFFLEQLYRAYKINNNEKYHK